MSYEVKFTLLIKTMGKKYTHTEMIEVIVETLWTIQEFRDIQLFDYSGDTEEDENEWVSK